MKGLLIKDLRFMLQNKKIFVSVLFITIVFFITLRGERAIFLISYVTTMCGTLVLNTISMDEFDKSIAFLMTMPINREIYTKEKYVFAFLSSLFGWLVATLPCAVLGGNQVMEILGSAVAVFAVLYLFQMIMLPITLKFGNDKGRMVLLILAGVVVMFCVMMEKSKGGIFAEQVNRVIHQMADWGKSLNGWMIGVGGCLIYVICFIVSFGVSVRVMEKKEF